jgi:hypothetical protein
MKQEKELKELLAKFEQLTGDNMKIKITATERDALLAALRSAIEFERLG